MVPTLVGIGASLIAPKIMSQFRDQKVKVIHAMPGRLRLQCDSWKHTIVAEALGKQVQSHPLILTSKASEITGSLVIEFIVPHISQDELDEIMTNIVQIASNAILHKDAMLMNGMKNTLQFIDKGIKKQTNGFADFDSLFILFLLGKGIQSFGNAPAFSASLLYWSYSIMKNKGDSNR
ncbi:HMA2 domain-containing protein [Peribacillus sp. NPDC096448]|uniref:HMA2 domain-containing protein n=1 Tax=Peribacillus sp. NPDC096448 TaxID=3364395 RepID=UPI0037F15A39